MKKTFLLLIIFLLLSFFIYGCYTHGYKNANIDREKNIVVIETSLKLGVEDIINAFNLTDSAYFHNKEENPILNKVEPTKFYYLDGSLLSYIFESEVECSKAVKNVNEVFTEKKLLASGLIKFTQKDFKTYIYKANNALVIYIPKYTINTKMNRSMKRLLFLKEAGEKGLNKEMLNLLGNLGFSYQEILDMPQAKIDKIFAPGTHLDGGGFDPNEQQKDELTKVGIDTSMSVILYNLGYEYEEMLKLSPEEIDFIFPNTELVANLIARGYKEDDVQSWAVLRSGKTYKEIIKEAMQKPKVEKNEPAEVQFAFYPSGSDFIETIIDNSGSVEITGEMRDRFNNFARDYRLIYMPDMNYYESFFEADQYAESFAYNNFGFAVFYVLQYMKCPEKISAEAMQNYIQSLFVAKDSYQDMTHQAFRKLAAYENGYYSPWSEGGLDNNRIFYLLTGLDISQEESDVLYITIRSKSYYFEHPASEAGENEKWLEEKSKELGVTDLQAAAELIMSGEIEEDLEGRYEYETTIYININEQNGYNPRFVSNRSCNIEHDEPFSEE